MAALTRVAALLAVILTAVPAHGQDGPLVVDPSGATPSAGSASALPPTPPSPSAPAAEQGFYYIDRPPQPVEADAVAVPEVHVVQAGDTLWDLCAFYFDNPWLWQTILGYNPQIANPHWIYPGAVVHLVAPGPASGPTSGGGPEATPAKPLASTRGGAAAAPASPRIVFFPAAALAGAGRIVGSSEEKLMLAKGDGVLVSYPKDRPLELRLRYLVFGQEEEILHPRTGERIGAYVTIRGELEVIDAAPGKAALAILTSSREPIERGDRVGRPTGPASPRAASLASAGLEAQIVDVVGARALVGAGQLVLLDRGANDGLGAGDRLRVVRRGDAYRTRMATKAAGVVAGDGRFPDETLAEITVVSVDQRTAVALVTRAHQETEVGDRAVLLTAVPLP